MATHRRVSKRHIISKELNLGLNLTQLCLSPLLLTRYVIKISTELIKLFCQGANLDFLVLFAPVIAFVLPDELVQAFLYLLVVGIDLLVDLVQLQPIPLNVLLE